MRRRGGFGRLLLSLLGRLLGPLHHRRLVLGRLLALGLRNGVGFAFAAVASSRTDLTSSRAIIRAILAASPSTLAFALVAWPTMKSEPVKSCDSTLRGRFLDASYGGTACPSASRSCLAKSATMASSFLSLRQMHLDMGVIGTPLAVVAP